MDWEEESSAMEVEECCVHCDRYNFTEDQKHQNYQRILKTIKFLENNGKITEDWFIKHSALIAMYRVWIPDFSILDTDNYDKEFRDLANETERVITTLMGLIQVYRFIDTTLYLQLVKNIKKLYENIMTERDLNDCMSKMSM
jgi:hypothetical protein